MSVPRCGVDHRPIEEFFAREDAGSEITGALVLTFMCAAPIAFFALLAVALSQEIFGVVAAVGVIFWIYQMVFAWRERIVGGLFADDLHVGRIDMGWVRMRRKVFDRKQVGEVHIERGRLTVLDHSGVELFGTSMYSRADVTRFAAFVGGKVVDVAPGPPRGIAVPPAETRVGVLPLRVRRAAGLLGVIGGLVLAVGLVNIPLRLAFTPESRWTFILELLASLVVYGAVNVVLAIRLGRGMTWSRESALILNPAVTATLLVALLVFSNFPPAVAVFALLFVPVSAVVAYWLRKPLDAR